MIYHYHQAPEAQKKTALRIAPSRRSVSWDVARKNGERKNRGEVQRERAAFLTLFLWLAGFRAAPQLRERLEEATLRNELQCLSLL